MRYVDAFVIAIPKKNLNAYKKMAALGGKTWMKHGALEYMESVGEDINPKGALEAKMLTFPKLLKLKKDEVPVFSYIVFKSRKHRDAVNAKVMKDPAMSPEAFKDTPMPFAMNRMSYGGFEAMVDL
jgi:uncharacterized protein YbaA (DUF1428 family)